MRVRSLAFTICAAAVASCAGGSGNGSANTSVTDSLRIVEAPRALTRGESLQLLVVTGPVPQGALIVFRLAPTDTLGVLAPFGPDATSNGGTYTIPIPARFTAPRLTVIVTVESQDGSLRRAPGNDEIRSLQLVILPAG